MKALVINCRRNGLGVIRSLGEEGVKVIAVDVINAPGLYSKYVHKKFIFKDAQDNIEILIDKLVQIGMKESNGERIFLFPMNDQYISLLNKHFGVLEKYYFPVFEVNSSVLDVNISKSKMYKIASKAGVPYPKTEYSPLKTEPLNIGLPCIVKPSQRKILSKEIQNEILRIKFCNTKKELIDYCSKLDGLQVEYVVQEFIEGGDDTLYTAGLFVNKGELVAISTARKLRQFPPHTGECSLGELVAAPEIIKYSKSFVAQTGITGICQIEFKKNGGDYYLMEINPRSWSWNYLMTYSGVNLPYLACMSLLGELKNTELIRSKRESGKWMFALQDFKYNVYLNKNISIFKYLRDLISADVYAHWRLSDPLPFFSFLYFNIFLGRKL